MPAHSCGPLYLGRGPLVALYPLASAAHEKNLYLYIYIYIYLFIRRKMAYLFCLFSPSFSRPSVTGFGWLTLVHTLSARDTSESGSRLAATRG